MKNRSARRALSWLWPLTEARVEGLFGPIEARWEQGRLVANSSFGNQSFGSLHRIWQDTFARIALSADPPRSALLLGLGTGSVPHILRNELGLKVPVTAVELDPAMIRMGRDLFGLDTLAGLEIVEGDATVQVHGMRDRYDLVLVDLFDDLDLARGVDTPGFAQALRARCDVGGTVCFNTVGYNPESDRRCDRVHENLVRVFDRVDESRLEGVNRVFIAR
ncbi:MAG TPA: fused MFS/spermidine synthase [Flavobacteriales bacterium]|nr:fused MFS/spermidine synthase [Flavobacteriales bacterium]